MNDSARDLVHLLQDLGERERDVDELEAACPRVQHLLATALGPPTAERLEYASYDFEWGLGDPTTTLQGLATTHSQILLTEIIDQLAALSDTDPSPLPELGLTPAQTRAAFFAAYWILDSLQWQSRDRSIPSEFPPDKRQRMLDATLRSLQSFRDTGDP